MRIWVVSHPYRERAWLRVGARVLGQREMQEGFVWAEWRDRRGQIPLLPPPGSTSDNVDPLVVGRHMYFDYCKKRRSRDGVAGNARRANSLSRGDLVLFGCAPHGRMIIDTVFAIGEVREWRTTGLPRWKGIDEVARRVHFHDAAHLVQHPEVHRPSPTARSYRGAAWGTSRMFAWVPFRERMSSAGTLPFALSAGCAAYQKLARIYGEPEPRARMKLRNGFGVVEVTESEGRSLFEALLDQARAQGFGIAVRIELPQADGPKRRPRTGRGQPSRRQLCSAARLSR